MPVTANASGPLYEFERVLEGSTRIHGLFRENCVRSHDSIREAVHFTTAERIVAQAFVGVLAGWEDYLEGTFLRYMVGGRTQSGYSPDLRLGPCSSLDHARQVLGADPSPTQATRRFRWSDYRWVEAAARLYFHRGEPYNLGSPELYRRLDFAYAIRNRVVHNSAQAKKKFKESANIVIGAPVTEPLGPGVTPGTVLVYQGENLCFDLAWISSNTEHWGDLFEAFVVYFYDLSGLITPL